MTTILLAAFAIFAVVPIGAQPSGGASTPQKVLQETDRVVKQAQSSAKSEAARQMADRAADNGRLGELAAEAQRKLTKISGPDERKLIQAVDERLGPALQSAAPEGRTLISQSAAAPAMRAPDPDAPAASPSPKAPEAAAAGGKKGKTAESPPNDIDIRCEGAVYLDSAQAMAIFTEDVVLDHPQFHMTSDKLEVYFIKESAPKPEPEKAPPGKNPPAAKPAEPAVAPKAQPAEPPPPPPQAGDAKLKQAIATGRKVVVRKMDENGEPQIGICRHLTYIGESGDVILREMPQVQRGGNVIVARDSSTYMVMKQNGELKVHGPSDTKIQQKLDTAGKPKAPAAAPAGAAPSAPISTPKKTAKK